MVDITLVLLIIGVFTLPLTNRKVEENLEIFICISGILAVTIIGGWSKSLLKEALEAPVNIAIAVCLVGFIFKHFHTHTRTVLKEMIKRLGLAWSLFFIVVVLGAVSSITTAIIAALILAEAASTLAINRETKIKLVVYACFSIGVGAVLTPIGEPLGTIVLSKLKDAPHYADTFFMLKHLSPFVFSIILIMGTLAYRLADGVSSNTHDCEEEALHSAREIFMRTFNVYIFVAGLILLGEGLKPLAYKTIFKLSTPVIYWVNIISAALDNATLASIEIVPEMSTTTIIYLLVSLLIAGGMLIPSNIPNIITSSKLKITSKEWAKIGVPLGLILLAVYFFILLIFVPYNR